MPTLTPGRVRHGVVFSLKHAEGSPEEADFLKANAALASIPGVEAFELMREVSPKNDYRFALVMEFADRAAYDAYSAHPDHVLVRVRALGQRGHRLPRAGLRSAVERVRAGANAQFAPVSCRYRLCAEERDSQRKGRPNMATIRRLSSIIRANRERAQERLEHDRAMLDRGVAAEHAASITRATARGEAGCSFCG